MTIDTTTPALSPSQDDLDIEALERKLANSNPYAEVDMNLRDETAVFSITNFRMQYIQKLMAVSWHSYITRLAKNGPDDESRDDFIKRVFVYDVDKHTSEENTATRNDPEREAKLADLNERISAEKTERSQPDPQDQLGFAYNLIAEARLSVQNALRKLPEDSPEAAVLQILSIKLRVDPHIDDNIDQTGLVSMAKDRFTSFNYYLRANYEQLNNVTQVMFCEKPDLNYAVRFLQAFPTPEQASKFIKSYCDEFVSTVNSVGNKQWTIIGDYNENLERQKFYGENQQIICDLMDNIAKDKETRKEILKKKVESTTDNMNFNGNKSDLSEYIALRKRERAGEILSQADRERKAALAAPDGTMALNVYEVGKDEIKSSTVYSSASYDE